VVAKVTPDSLAPVAIGDTGVEVSLPSSIFEELDSDELFVTATGFTEEYAQRLNWPSDSWDSEGGAPVGQGATHPGLVSVDVQAVLHLGVQGHDVSDLPEPIEIDTGVNFTEDVECAFWDEPNGAWSTEGVVSEEGPNGQLICKATHLSLFGAILRGFVATFQCSQVTLLRADAFKELGKGYWYKESGAWVLWLLVAAFGVLGLSAAAVDFRRSRHTFWNDEHFLIVVEPEDIRRNESEEFEEEEEEECCGCCCFSSCCDSMRTWCKESNALRDALDEIASSYFKHFGEARDLCEALVDGVQCSSSCRGFEFIRVLQSAMTRVMANSAQRQAAAAEGISADFASFAMEDDDLHHLLVKHSAKKNNYVNSNAGPVDGDPSEGLDGTEMALALSQRSEGERKLGEEGFDLSESNMNLYRMASVTSERETAEERAKAWSAVLEGLTHQTHRYSTEAVRYRSVPSAVCRLLLWQHPIGICLLRCVFLTSKVRVLLFLVDSMGSVMLGTIFFTTTGTVPSKKNRSTTCATETVGEAFGRLLAIAVASVILSSIPAMFLGSLCTRGIKKMTEENSRLWKRQLLIWKVQDVMIWVFGLAYLGFCLLFICLFLANTEPKEQGGWLVSIVVSLLLDNLLIPLAVAVAVPLLAALCASMLSCAKRSTKKQIMEDVTAEVASKPNMTLPVVKV